VLLQRALAAPEVIGEEDLHKLASEVYAGLQNGARVSPKKSVADGGTGR
jgi:hypothetical protein